MSRADYEISAENLQKKLESPERPVILDVRRPDELAICGLAGAEHIPLDELQDRLEELDRQKEIVVICHHGVRSLSATAFLRTQGFENVWSLAGGIDRWAAVVDPSVPRY